MKIGTIVINPFAGENNPIRRGVYIGNNKVMTMDFKHITTYDRLIMDKLIVDGFAELKETQKKPKNLLEVVVSEKLDEYPNINQDAFTEWMAYKKYKSKGAITKTLNMLNKYDHQTQQDMVDLSIGNEYKGLFPPKTQAKPLQSFKQQDKQEENDRLDKGLEHNVFDLIELRAQQEQGVIDAIKR